MEMAGRGNFSFQNNYPNQGHNSPYQNNPNQYANPNPYANSNQHANSNQYANSNQFANNSQRSGAYSNSHQSDNNVRYGAYNAQDSMGTESRKKRKFYTPNASNKIDYDMAMALARDYRSTTFEIIRNGEELIPLYSLQVDQVNEFEDSHNIYMEAERKVNEYLAQQASGPVSNTTTGTPVDTPELRALITSIVREQIAEILQQASASILIGNRANMPANEHNQASPPQQSSAQLGQTSTNVPYNSQFIKPEP